MTLILASTLPVIILMIYFYLRDKYEKEPVKSLAKAFFAGVLSTVAALLLGSAVAPFAPFGNSAFFIALHQSFVQAAIPEEICKFALLYIFIWRDRNFNEYFDGIIYSVFVALGFACVENVMYIFGYGMEIAVSRALLAVPLHALCGVIMGYYFSLAKFSGRKTENLLKGVFFAILAHGVYDFILFYFNSFAEILPFFAVISTLLVFVVVGFLWKISFAKINRMVENSVFKKKNDEPIA